MMRASATRETLVVVLLQCFGKKKKLKQVFVNKYDSALGAQSTDRRAKEKRMARVDAAKPQLIKPFHVLHL